MYAFVLKYWCINSDFGKILFLEFLQKKPNYTRCTSFHNHKSNFTNPDFLGTRTFGISFTSWHWVCGPKSFCHTISLFSTKKTILLCLIYEIPRISKRFLLKSELTFIWGSHRTVAHTHALSIFDKSINECLNHFLNPFNSLSNCDEFQM